MADFAAKHVLITGAANGIGAACARLPPEQSWQRQREANEAALHIMPRYLPEALLLS